VSVVFYCPCGGEIAPGGTAHVGGGDCLSCGKSFADTDAIGAAGGTAAIVSARRAAQGVCQVEGCGSILGVALCDEPVGARRTCDLRLCEEHRVRVGHNRDRCPRHGAGKVMAR
jgi:hypothetical protein